ncbi:MAG TPA: DUF6290 family protein [Nitrosopumilus sp.]|nr:DUF6290 family protein [Thermoproteota archaeon]HJJ22946.1 DUF6290 family protein [Nitrosopumilus sp.]
MQKVVSTKLTEDEHTKLLDMCNFHGCTPSSFIKQAIMEKIDQKEEIESNNELSNEDIEKILGI